MLKSVDLPAPFSPTRPITDLVGTTNLTSSRTGIGPKLFDNPATRRSSVIDGRDRARSSGLFHGRGPEHVDLVMLLVFGGDLFRLAAGPGVRVGLRIVPSRRL